jgi:hypothetical protein
MVGDWLLCDFHIHTALSDGALPLPEVIDLYGRAGFDVINISDHIFDKRSLAEWLAEGRDPRVVQPHQFDDYMRVLWREARRAWDEYGLLVIPGFEVTNNADGYHILAVDTKEYVEPRQSVQEIVRQLHGQGAIAVAPHPHRGSLDGTDQLMHLWENHLLYVDLFDAWEVANRDDLFNVVGLKKFNYIANSDFHEARHLYSWKTLLRCEKNREAVKSAIRSNDGVSIYLFREGMRPSS